MQVEPLVVGQPEADVLELVRRVVVQNDMHRRAFRDLLVDLGEELEELLVIESGTRSPGHPPRLTVCSWPQPPVPSLSGLAEPATPPRRVIQITV